MSNEKKQDKETMSSDNLLSLSEDAKSVYVNKDEMFSIFFPTHNYGITGYPGFIVKVMQSLENTSL
jgi:hypothetical protein